MNESQKIGFVSLGCPKALVDSERILTQLRIEGYDIEPKYEGADLVIVNTCGFIDSAIEESFDAIGEALDENGRVIVTGCMGAKPGEIEARFPKVLAVTGPQAYEEVMTAVHQHLPPRQTHDSRIDLVPPQGVKLTPRHYAYLKISEGCNHKCSFCIIPSMRGKLVSRPAGDVIAEAERLVASGVKELLVISQDTSAYGLDTRYATSFWNGRPVKARLKELCEVLAGFGIWVRLHYVYPYPHVDDIIPLMADGKLLPYLDIPFQHASPRILKSMKRPAATERNLDRIEAWRSICPDITLRSTFIVGFPGETDEDFEELLEFLREARLDRVGCFQYSPVDGATANDLANPVPAELAEERWHRFMSVQAEISSSRLAEKVGRTIQVLVDGYDDSGAVVARSSADAPEIDGNVIIENPAERLTAGEFCKVKITDSGDYDLWAEVLT
ncbi:ribosomal protein S12 methylthiotransferase [Chromatiales bacterium (ex Bugula neritina AB1)]|nr:ribosomal protein S12 methylthiotransferase [Chromatiales bacterium (ex Bugula neritina AB1)]